MATSLTALQLPLLRILLPCRVLVIDGRRLGFRYTVGGRGMGVRFTR